MQQQLCSDTDIDLGSTLDLDMIMFVYRFFGGKTMGKFHIFEENLWGVKA